MEGGGEEGEREEKISVKALRVMACAIIFAIAAKQVRGVQTASKK